MATYEELRALYKQGSVLEHKIEVAISVAMSMIATGDDTATNDFSEAPDLATARGKRRAYAADHIANMHVLTAPVMRLALAASRTAPASGLADPQDSAVQSAVNKVIDLLAGN